MLMQSMMGSHQEALLDDLVVREDETHAVSLHARLRKHCLRGRVLGQYVFTDGIVAGDLSLPQTYRQLYTLSNQHGCHNARENLALSVCPQFAHLQIGLEIVQTVVFADHDCHRSELRHVHG